MMSSCFHRLRLPLLIVHPPPPGLGPIGGGASASPSISQAPPAAPSPPNLEENVRLMSEMGILDEALSRQALLMTNGDVQAAVELVFAQQNMFD